MNEICAVERLKIFILFEGVEENDTNDSLFRELIPFYKNFTILNEHIELILISLAVDRF